jgi:uncharacterized protein with FMN-binding domain
MRRAIVAGTATASGLVLLLGLKPHGATAAGTPQSFSIGSSAGASSPSTGSGSGTRSTPSPAASSAQAAGPDTGTKTVTGAAADTRYGPVQLQVTFSGTKITNISVLEYPAESGRDQQINDYALPILNQEAIAAQSASIDAVSGATFTSDGYMQSLQSAIDKARA